MGKKTILVYRMVVLYLLLPVSLFFIPLSSVNKLHSICLYKNLFEIECPGCGITRAVLYVIHCRLSEAIALNKLIVIVFPLLAYLFVRQLICDIRKFQRAYNNGTD
ncbi:MAG: DUF2752 domain-containing protein [Elusimicrobia bacterium]|nr:DUF2752 domain-containing protein [Elusimicrobiota bacterium]